jgi:hypothetical protein
MSTAYRFDNQWQLRAPSQQVYVALAEVEDYQQWWPQIRQIQRIDDNSGRVRIRSLLPYPLDLVLARAVEDEARGILRVDIAGDLQGWCGWQLVARGQVTTARFSQEVHVMVPMLQRVPFAIRPLLRGNHAHMMRSGERGLRRYLT